MVTPDDFRKIEWRWHKIEQIEDTLAYYTEVKLFYQMVAEATGLTIEQVFSLEQASASRYGAHAHKAHMARMEPILKRMEQDAKEGDDWRPEGPNE